MITDGRITELWNAASNAATSKPDWTYSEIIFATVRAVIAEHDAELRKQEPKAVWLQMSNETGFPSRVNSEAHLCAIKHPDFAVENLYLTPKPPHDEASLKALYAAPIPPMPSQQEALNDLRELDTNFEFEGRMAVLRNHLHHFILARPDAPLPPEVETFSGYRTGRISEVKP